MRSLLWIPVLAGCSGEPGVCTEPDLTVSFTGRVTSVQNGFGSLFSLANEDAAVGGTVSVCTARLAADNRLSDQLVEIEMRELPPIALLIGDVHLESTGPTTLWLSEGYSPDGEDIGDGIWVQSGSTWLVDGAPESLTMVLDVDEPTGDLFHLDEPMIEVGHTLTGRLWLSGSGGIRADVDEAMTVAP